MKRSLCLSMLLLASICTAQDAVLWTKSIGGDGGEGARSIALTNDGGFIVAGYTYSTGAGHSDLLLVRTDPEGSQIWQSAFGGPGSESGYSVTATTDGGFVTAGFTTSFGSGDRDIYLLKCDSQGRQEWAQSFGGDHSDVARSVAETSDGGFVICGSSQSFGDGTDTLYLIRTDASGNEIWWRNYGGVAEDNGRSVVETAEGGFLLSGGTGTYGGGNRDIWLLEVDNAGVELWSEAFGHNSNYDWGSHAVQTANGGVLAVGHGDIHGSDLLSMILLRTDGDGQQIWRQRFSEGFYDYGTSCLETVDGDLLAVGITKTAQDLSNDAALRLLDASGQALWTEIVGGEGTQSAQDVVEVADGFVVVGSTDATASGSHDLWMAKVSNVTPNFAADLHSGHAPLEVHFEDSSTGAVSTWQWDFDNDGVIDSEERHPTWVYARPGVFTVRLVAGHEGASRTLVREELISVSNNPRAPRRTAGRVSG